MAKKTAPLLPSTDELLRQFGARLRLARLRRHLSAKQVAERAGMAPMTLRNLEHGEAGVTMGAYLAVMQVLGIEKDLNLLGAADPLGRELQDAKLSARISKPVLFPPKARLSKREKTPKLDKSLLGEQANEPAELSPIEQVNKTDDQLKQKNDAANWMETSDFISSEVLAELLDSSANTASQKKKEE